MKMKTHRLVHVHPSGEDVVRIGTREECIEMAADLYPDGFRVERMPLLDASEEWIQENPARGIVAAVVINALFWGAIILFMP